MDDIQRQNVAGVPGIQGVCKFAGKAARRPEQEKVRRAASLLPPHWRREHVFLGVLYV